MPTRLRSASVRAWSRIATADRSAWRTRPRSINRWLMAASPLSCRCRRASHQRRSRAAAASWSSPVRETVARTGVVAEPMRSRDIVAPCGGEDLCGLPTPTGNGETSGDDTAQRGGNDVRCDRFDLHCSTARTRDVDEPHDDADWNFDARHETTTARLDRNWNDLLQ